MNKLKIVYLSPDKITKYASNSRTHSKQQVDQVKASIVEFGMCTPIGIHNGSIVYGHARYDALCELGYKEIPTVDLGHMTDAQKKAYIIADNKLALNAGWNDEMLRLEFQDLQEMGFDLDLTGFSAEELDKLMPKQVEGLTDEDAVPEVPIDPVTVPGDVWILGDHRLMCGDSTSIDAVEKLMDGQKADMVFTSPPYNADTKAGDGDIFTSKKSKKLYGDGYSDKLPSKDYVDFASSVLEICFSVTDGFIFWNVSYNAKSKNEYIKQIFNRLDYLVEQVCWKKSSTIPFKGCLMRDWEPIYIFSTNKQNLNTKNVVSNFWQISNTGAQQENHKACFPVALPEKGISLVNSNSGIVFEPFCGSGSTLVASEKNGRKCYAMELDPKYCDVIIKRWQEFTGKQAVHAETGEAFNGKS